MKTESTLCAIFCLSLLACSSPEGEPANTPTPGGGQTSAGGSGNAPGGGSGGTTVAGNGGVVGGGSGGQGTGGTPGGGAAGTPGAGTGGGGGPSGGSGGGIDPGDTPPWRPLNIFAAPDLHTHTVGGRDVGVDTRAPIMMGKLIVDVGVTSGGRYDFALDRGFHVYGGNMESCELTYDNHTENGNCRLEVFDGIDRTSNQDNTPQDSLLGRLAAHLAELHATYPEEDWGYFLNEDGTVRLSDVGFTGFSHGAQSVARWARAYRVYRAVSRSGPRDNECGTGAAGLGPASDFNAADPPWQNNAYAPHPDGGTMCDRISDWLLEESMTPVDRLFGFVGKDDGQYGDIILSMEIMQYIGQPVNISTAQAPYDGSHRFYAEVGHNGFDDEEFWPAMGIAWGVPQENMDYAAGL